MNYLVRTFAALVPIIASVGIHAGDIETAPATIKWASRWCGPGQAPQFATVGEAQASLAQSCSALCVEYGIDLTPANPDTYYAGANVYSPCPPRQTVYYQYNADTIGARGSCTTPGVNSPGYRFQLGTVAGGGHTSGHCWIYLQTYDKTQKPCEDECVGNPILPGSGNKRQIDVDYPGLPDGSLRLTRTYNSAAQLGSTWRHNYDL